MRGADGQGGRPRRRGAAEGVQTAPAAGEEFPELQLPVRPGYPPMEAAAVQAIPSGEGWVYEPKWDGFRCLAFRDGERVVCTYAQLEAPAAADALVPLTPRAG